MSAKLPRPSSLTPYAEAGWSFVPLHHYSEVKKLPPSKKHPQGRILKLGKAPIGKEWTRKGVDLKTAVAHMNSRRNVGAIIPPGWAVIDVDPRNFKGEINSFDRLCKDTGLDPDAYPTVKTGSGGWHIFCRVPEGYRAGVVHDSYPGVEFKQSTGIQVVTAGSIHPDTQDYYEWMPAPVELREAASAPEKMLEIYKVQRPLITGAQGGDTWGTLTPRQIEDGLGLLDVTRFQSHDDWFGLMCSVNWLSGGEARQAFIDWSTNDPEYADQADKIAERWDSLARGSQSAQLVARGGLFFKWLKTLAGVEAHDSRFGVTLERAMSDVSFEETEEDLKRIEARNEVVREEAYKSAEAIVYEMNQKHFVLNWRGKTVVGTKRVVEEQDGTMYPKYEFQDAQSFKLFYSNRRMPDGVSYGEYWLGAKDRMTYDGFDFRPDEPPGSYRTASGDLMLNQWTGFATEPKKGDWSKFDELLREVICRGDMVKYEYILNWCAYSYQNVRGPIGVALVLMGKKGTGKTSFWEVWSKPFGPTHSMITAKMESVFGAHNGRMHAKLAIGLEEAYFAGSKMAEAQLKDLVTGRTFGVNEKFLPEYAQTNHSRIVIMTNDDWAVPATEDERRYLVVSTDEKRKNDHEFWKQFRAQMIDGDGSEAFFHDMLYRDISNFNPYRDVPHTEELLGQIEITRGPIIDWLHERMAYGQGAFPYTWTARDGGWVVPKTEFWEDFKQWHMGSPRGRFDAAIRSQAQFTRELNRVVDKNEYKVTTATPTQEAQIAGVRTYGSVTNGKEYRITNVFKFKSFEEIRRAIGKRYGFSFDEPDLADLEDVYLEDEIYDIDRWDFL